MYKSPIEIICGDIQKQIDNDIYRVTQKYDIKVDKNELIQALQYDRDQYEKGYADAKAEVVRCKDCKHRGTDYCIFHIKGEPADEELLRKLDNDFCSYGERREGE
jgi:hypothetical protein